MGGGKYFQVNAYSGEENTPSLALNFIPGSFKTADGNTFFKVELAYISELYSEGQAFYFYYNKDLFEAANRINGESLATQSNKNTVFNMASEVTSVGI